MSGPYDDIINLPHPTSTKHPRMPMSDRAAIFSPFAALTGHAAAIQETARLTDQRMELDEDTRAIMDLKQQILADRIAERPEVSVVWFRPDEKKDGGKYVTTVGQLKKVDDTKGNFEAFAAFAKQIFFRNLAVLENQFIGSGTADTHLLFLLTKSKSRSSFLHDKGRDTAASLAAIRYRTDKIDVRVIAVRDENLRPVEEPVSPRPFPIQGKGAALEDIYPRRAAGSSTAGADRQGQAAASGGALRVNPKFCVKSISGANRAKFICCGSRLVRLPPCQQHNAGGGGCQGRRSRSFYP